MVLVPVVLVTVPLLAVLGAPARATGAPPAAPAAARHVVIVGISGLTWDIVNQSRTQELWRLAAAGSVGSLVDYAQEPLACPADGWLTLNSAARAQGPRPCTSLPAVTRSGAGASVPAMPQIIQGNEQFHESPDWGLLGTLASCATAVGPGAALALASPSGAVSSYLPSPADLSAPVLARCPLTVVDLGQIAASERGRVSAVDAQLAGSPPKLPRGTLLLVTAPGAAAGTGRGQAPAGPPHLMSVLVSGPGYAGGLLGSAATRRAGIVTLTDLTPTVAAWLGHPVPAGTVGARITRGERGDLDATIAGLTARDTAEQVWIATHGWFFIGYADRRRAGVRPPRAALLGRRGGPPSPSRPVLAAGRRGGGRGPARLVPGEPGPVAVLGAPRLVAVRDGDRLDARGRGGRARRAVAARRARPVRRDLPATLLLLAVDAMTGSRLQLEAPFGLSLLVSGRFYGIGNDALGVYCVSTLVAAGWLAAIVTRTRPVLVVGVVGLLAVVASGWPGFGAKVGGTIALVPCLLLLAAWLSGVRVRRRWAVPFAVSGLVLFLAFALASYFIPGAGVSDMGTFAGDLLHGRGGDLLQRKVSANVGSLTLNVFSWLIPVAAVLAGVALWQPAALRLRTLAFAFAALPLVRVLAWLSWLVLVIGWLADDSGVIVPAVALPFVVPLTIAMAASVNPDLVQFP